MFCYCVIKNKYILNIFFLKGKEDDDDAKYWSHLKNRKTPDIPIQPLESPIAVLTDDIPGATIESTATVDTAGPAVPEKSPSVNRCASSRRRIRSVGNDSSEQNVEYYKIKIMEQDYNNRALKFNTELDHLKKINALELELKKQELEHKSKMFKLHEEELKLKIEILKNKNTQ